MAGSICGVWATGIGYSNVHFNNIQTQQLSVEILIKEMFYVMKNLFTYNMPSIELSYIYNWKETKELVKYDQNARLNLFLSCEIICGLSFTGYNLEK